jgi:hypothetical protein
MARDCKKCLGKCTIVSVDCFREESVFFTQAVEALETKKAMNKAQKTYIVGLIGSTCFTELCDAILASELPTNDLNYVALAQKWEDLIEMALALLVAAVEYDYIGSRGFGVLTAQGFNLNASLSDGKIWANFLATLKGNLDAAYKALEDWLKDPVNRVNYSCLPALPIDDTCAPLEDEGYATGWATTAYRPDGYPRNRY